MSTRFAPAKINLYLHVTGRREDGYHFLDSLVVFLNIGDTLRLEPAQALSFKIEGPMAPALAHEDGGNNLVMRAARALGAALGREPAFTFTLTKNLPVASGIGGGSTDAAAALMLLAEAWGIEAADPLLPKIAATLGQDVPCCLAAQTCYFRGIGDQTSAGPALPHTNIVLVNPRQALATPSVYKARSGPFIEAAPPLPDLDEVQALAFLLKARTNNLTEAAIGLCPEVKTVLNAIEGQEDCLLARMSGSGASCFGIFSNRADARTAAARLYQAHPDWWVVPASFPAHP